MLGTSKYVSRAIARVPGSCGELAQGLIDDCYFLVSCPIDLFATASVTVSPGSGRVFAPSNVPKAHRAVELTLAHLGRTDMDARLALSSQLPRGKGMASSTADVSASIAATAAALGEAGQMTPAEIARLAILIEPSDGLMLPGISVFDHRNGALADSLGTPPPMRVLALDFGGNVDTLEFNNVDRVDVLRGLQPSFEEAFELIVRGVADGRARDIAAGATLSAVANQQVLYKPRLDDVLELAERIGALGVNVAHSGTVMGMLFEEDSAFTRRAALQVRQSLPCIKRIYDLRIVSGGVYAAAI